MMESPGQIAYKLAFEISPIMLTNGVASLIGGMLPLISVTEGINFLTGILSGANISINSFFANFQVLPGTSLIDQQVGTYPFANQNTAANAVIAQPLMVSMLMICPVREPGGYFTKLAILTALRELLATHNNSGGTYTIATPSYLYTDCVMTGMKDVSTGDPKQPQDRWRLDFVQPLVTLQQANQVQNSLMSKLTQSMPTTGALSGASALSSPFPIPGVSAAVIPAAGTATASLASGTPSMPFGLTQ